MFICIAGTFETLSPATKPQNFSSKTLYKAVYKLFALVKPYLLSFFSFQQLRCLRSQICTGKGFPGWVPYSVNIASALQPEATSQSFLFHHECVFMLPISSPAGHKKGSKVKFYRDRIHIILVQYLLKRTLFFIAKNYLLLHETTNYIINTFPTLGF